MLFKNIVGQDNSKNQLLRSINEERIGHAQIFIGQEGSGSLALAIAYAQYINCENKQKEDSCGTCHSCMKYEKLIHPDLHFVYPVANTSSSTKSVTSDDYLNDWREMVLSNPYFNLQSWYMKIDMENKQGNIGKDESVNIIKKLNLKTYESDYKIMIIWMAEKMNDTCANKILKILEEPPDKTIFLLVCESTETVLPTILSRCQMVKIPKLNKKDIQVHLEEKYGQNSEDAAKIARLANGNVNDVLMIMNNENQNNENYNRFIELMRIAYKKDVPGIIKWVDSMGSLGREGLKTFFEYALHMTRENFMMNHPLENIIFLNDEEENFSKNFHMFIQEENIHKIVDEFTKAYIHIERNAYNKIVLLDMSLTLFGLINPRKNV